MKDELIERLGFPKKSVVNRILAKNVISQSADLTSRENERLTTDIERIYILATMNEASTNIGAYHSEHYLYEEIVCLHVLLRSKEKVNQFLKLFHTMIPNPVWLILESPEQEYLFSTCHKRLNQQDETKVVVEEIVSTDWFELQGEYERMMEELYYKTLPSVDLLQFYQGIEVILLLSKSIHYAGKFPEDRQNSKEIVERLYRIKASEQELETMKREQNKTLEFNERLGWHMKMKQVEKNFENEMKKLKEMI